MYTFIIIFLVIHLLCCLEIVGSWFLTNKSQDLHWNPELNLLPLLFPLVSLIVALDIVFDAWPRYRYGKENSACHYQESLLLYLFYGCRSIKQWCRYSHGFPLQRQASH